MPAVIWTCLFLLGFVQCGMRFLLNTFKLKKKKNYGKKKLMKFAIPTIFQFSSVKYIHIAVPQICRTFSSCLLRCLFCTFVRLLFALLLVPFTQKAPTEAC